MTRYTVAALPGGWTVVLNSPSGRRIALGDYPSRAVASREAERLNTAWQHAESRRLAQSERIEQAAERARRIAARIFRTEPEFA